MRKTRGLILGFIVGAVIGLLVYLRLRRLRVTGEVDEGYLRLEIDTLMNAPPQTNEESAGPVVDPLQRIRGIGPVYAERLQAAGVNTFSELAARTPEQLQAILGPRVGVDMLQGWIEEAGQIKTEK